MVSDGIPSATRSVDAGCVQVVLPGIKQIFAERQTPFRGHAVLVVHTVTC